MRGNDTFFSNLLARFFGGRRKKKSRKNPARVQRCSGFETLEERRLMSVSPAAVQASDNSAFVAPAQLTVTNLSDAPVTPGTLAYAVREIDSNPGVDCAINFAPTLFSQPQTITLTSGRLELTSGANVTIVGPGANLLTVDCYGGSAFAVDSGATLNLTGVSIVNAGSSGIVNNGTLGVTSSTFSGDSAAGGGGGIINTGTLTVTSSTFSGDSAAAGGGIYNAYSPYNAVTAAVTACTFSANSAASDGGGIDNNGTLTVTSSAFSGDSAAQLGGGVGRAENFN